MTRKELQAKWPGWEIEIWEGWGGTWGWSADIPDLDAWITGDDADSKAEAIAKVDDALTAVRCCMRSRGMGRAT